MQIAISNAMIGPDHLHFLYPSPWKCLHSVFACTVFIYSATDLELFSEAGLPRNLEKKLMNVILTALASYLFKGHRKQASNVS